MDYHGRIMNIEVDVASMAAAGKPRSLRFAFKAGHRDARHAAAEIANEADATIAAKAAEIARLREALTSLLGAKCWEDDIAASAQARAALAQVAESRE